MAPLWYLSAVRPKQRPRRPGKRRSARLIRRVNASVQLGELEPKCRPDPDNERAQLLSLLPRVEDGISPCLTADDALFCTAVRRALAGTTNRLVLTIVRWPEQRSLIESFISAAAALRVPTCALVLSSVDEDFRAYAHLEAAGVTIVPLPGSPSANILARKWSAITRVLSMHVAVLYADVDVVLTHPPFELLAHDSDVEVLSEAWEDEGARGFIFGSDDPSMGWGRYAESMRISFFSPALVYLQPTRSARALTALLATLAERQRWRTVVGTAWEAADASHGEAKSLTFELAAPAHDEVMRVGASFRVLPFECWMHGRTSTAVLTQKQRRPAALLVGRGGEAAAAVKRAHAAVAHFHRGEPALGPSWEALRRPLPWRHAVERTRVDPIMGAPLVWKGARHAAMRTKCRGTLPPRGSRLGTNLSRPLHWLVPPQSEKWPIGCDGSAAALCAVVSRVAIGRAVMVAVANKNIAHDQYLGRFADLVVAAKVPNFLVVALDNTTGAFLEKRGVAYYVRRLLTRTGADSSTTDNHATSALKFEILTELLSVGVSVLLSDVDVPVLQNPFLLLYRDSDVENMSDGWDDESVYGFVMMTELPADGGHGPLRSLRYETRNSGLMYVAATVEGLRTVRILATRMSKEAVWDQSAWNQETFRVAHRGFAPVGGASVRAMNYLCVLNTKVLFKYLPHDATLGDPDVHLPGLAHMNYHPEKEPRMAATLAFYQRHDRKALAAWNGGEGRNTGTCKSKVGVPTDVMPSLTPADLTDHKLARNVHDTPRPWKWGSSHRRLHGPVWFGDNGTLSSPWGNGTWGVVPGPWRKDALHVILHNQTYLLMFLSEKWAFVAVRCFDEQVSYGRLDADPIPENRLVW